MSDTEAAVRAAMLIGFGALEGYAFATSGMTYPAAFRAQMDFSKFILLQVFLGAVGSSMLIQALLSIIRHDVFDNSRVWKYTHVGLHRIVPGCALLGAGMAIAGSGPTMLPAQLAAGTTSALWTLLGAVGGGALFAFLEEKGWFHTDFTPRKEKKLVLEQVLGGHYALWASIFGSAMIAGCLAIPRMFDTSNDQRALSPLLTTAPILAGLSVGLNQIPVRVLSECGQGGSRALMQLVWAATGGKVAKRFKVKGISCCNQLAYVWGGTFAGALIASRALSLPAPPGYSIAESVIGGALMMFGARVAAGCTCGHGVSGFSELSLQSMVGAAAIFAGGIATVLLTGLKA